MFKSEKFWAQALILTLTTLLIVYLTDEAIFQESLVVSDAVYNLYALLLIIVIIPCAAFLHIFRNRTPHGVLIDNKVLGVSLIIIGLAFISGLSTSGEAASKMLDIVSVSTFYIVGIRLLQMSEPDLSQEDRQKSAINTFFKLFGISILVTPILIGVDYLFKF